MSYFVTGTDTHVGKTLISCALLQAFAAQGLRVVGMKPIAAGSDGNGQHEDVKKLRAASNILASLDQINPYIFSQPIAPHIAAHNSDVRVEIARILQHYRELAAQADVVIIEGVGGFCVPINESETSADMTQHLALPIILVVGVRLGCLNHALLTMSAIEARGLKCAGWVANVVDGNMLVSNENIKALQQRINAPLLGVVPWLPNQSPDAEWVAKRLNILLLNA
jgi:dethiobiotin synthetase